MRFLGLSALNATSCRNLVTAIAAAAALLTQSACTSDDSQNNQSQTTTSESATSAPTPKPVSRLELKRQFLATVDESVSGARIAGNPYKFVGKRVELHCTVSNIPQEDFFNATCGTDENDLPVVIVVETNTKDLEANQAVRIIGTVVEPSDGTNAMGGHMHFPTVKAEFME